MPSPDARRRERRVHSSSSDETSSPSHVPQHARCDGAAAVSPSPSSARIFARRAASASASSTISSRSAAA
eukprot:4166372-Prymnesium_polylepis.1